MRKHKGNNYEVHDGIVYMQASNRPDVIFTFDEEDLPKVLPYTWMLMPQGYIVTRQNPKTGKHVWRLHHCVLDFEYQGKDEVDHKDRNRLNNCKNNLRIVPHSKNNSNSKLRINSSRSGYIGVNWCEDKHGWVATIYKGKRYYQGTYPTIEEALIARLKAEKELFGEEFAPQRHLFKEYGI